MPANSRCSHKKITKFCVSCKILETGGTGLCNLHFKRINYCRECKQLGIPGHGNAICQHDISKYDCYQCSPESFCDHGVKFARCATCRNPKQICEHGKRSYWCIKCCTSKNAKNTAFCLHLNQRKKCQACISPELIKLPCMHKSDVCETCDYLAIKLTTKNKPPVNTTNNNKLHIDTKNINTKTTNNKTCKKQPYKQVLYKMKIRYIITK